MSDHRRSDPGPLAGSLRPSAKAATEREAWLGGQREALHLALNGAPLDASLGVLVRTATDQMGQDTRAAFYVANGEGTRLHLVAGMNPAYAEAVDGFRIGPESLACGLATHTGQPVITPDVTKEPRWAPWLWLAQQFDYRGCWSFPVQTEAGKFVGTFAVYSRQPRDATPHEWEFAELVTQTAAIIIVRHTDAVERGRAEAALRASEARQAYLLRLGDALRPLNDAVAVQQVASRLLGEHLGADRVAYGDVTDDDVHIEIAHNYVAPGVPPVTGRFRMAEFGDTLVAALLAGCTLVVPDVTASDALTADERTAWTALGISAFIGVPLVKDGRFVANLNVHHSAPRRWMPDEITLVEETAERTWAAVELSRLRRRAEELNSFLVRFSDAVRGLSDPGAVAETACRLVAEALGVERVYWAEVDWTTKEYVIGAAFQIPGVPVIEGRFPMDAWKPFTSYHLAGRPVVVDDTQADARIAPAVKEGYAQIAVGANLATPVLANGQLRCTLAVNQRLRRHWTPDEVALVHGIAGRCWAEVERARAEAALRDSEQRFRALSEAIPALAWRNDAEGANVFVNHQFVEFTGKTAEEISGTGWHSIIHPDDAEACIGDYLTDVQAHRPSRGQARYRRHDGAWRWHQYQTQPVLAKDGTYVGDIGVSFDVTERVEAEAALRESEQRFRALVTAGSHPIYRMSRDWRQMYQLDGHALLADTAEPIEDWLTSYILPEDRPRVIAAVEEAIRSESLFELEHRVRRADGGIAWVLSRAAPIFGPNGEIMEWFGAGIDVTARHKAEEALRASEERHRTELERQVIERTLELRQQRDLLQATMDSSMDMIQVFKAVRDERGEITDFCWIINNHTSESNYGDVLGQSLLERNPGVVQEGIFDDFKRVVDTGEPVQAERHYVHEQFDGWFFQSVVKLDDGVATTTKEITGWKEAQEEVLRLQDEIARAKLRESEERFRLLVENVQEYALFQTDLEGQVTSWNRGAERLFGYGGPDVLGQSAARLLTPEDQRTNLLQEELALVAKGQHHAEARWVVRKDGTRFWAQWVTEPVYDEAGQLLGVVKVLRDETERKQAEERQLLLMGELNHRVKNTLATVQSIASQTLRGDPDPVRFVEKFQARLQALARAHNLLTRHSWESANVTDIVRDQLTLDGDRDRIALDGPPAFLSPASAVALSLVLHELGTNARKYGALSVSSGRLHVDWRLRDGESVLQIEWTESGGPSVRHPERRGFGTTLIEKSLTGVGGAAELWFHSDGLVCQMQVPVAALRNGTTTRGERQ